MKRNRDKLIDAFDGLREDTLHDAVNVMETSSVTPNKRIRRWVVLIASCLAVAMILGCIIMIPFLSADEPITETTADPIATEKRLSYGEGPSVQLISIVGISISINGSTGEISYTSGSGFNHQCSLLFTGLKEGETVTLTSHYTRLAQGDVLGKQPYEWNSPLSSTDRKEQIKQDAQSSKYGHESDTNNQGEEDEGEEDAGVRMEYDWTQPVQKVGDYASTVTYDPSLSEQAAVVFLWDYMQLDKEARKDGHLYEDFVDFIIRDEEGRVTGLGSYYLADQKLTEDEEKSYYNHLSVSRGVLLGSVRFDDPAEVTEEDIQSLLEELHDKAKLKKSGIFDETTYTADEHYCKNLATIFSEHYGEVDHLSDLVIRSGSYREGWRHMVISTVEAYEKTRDFIFFEDGTFAEALEIKCICSYCGEVEILYHAFGECAHDLSIEPHAYYHLVSSVWYCYLNDGRIMSVNSGWGWKPTFITEDDVRT